MKQKRKKSKLKAKGVQNSQEADYPGYPSYPENEDAYTIWKEEQDLNPEDPTEKKAPNKDGKTLDTREFVDEVAFDELDIPGAELDDDMEEVGSEDEENNYYSNP